MWENIPESGLNQDHLRKVANTSMPFGRFKGKRIIDLPQPYLVWFSRNGFPDGEIGLLLRLALEIDQNGLKDIVNKLKK